MYLKIPIYEKMARHPTFDSVLPKEKEMQRNEYLQYTRLSVLFVSYELYLTYVRK